MERLWIVTVSLSRRKGGRNRLLFSAKNLSGTGGNFKGRRNEIFIRLECRDGKGRITPDKPCDVCFESGEKISLRGTWDYQVRVVSEQAPILTLLQDSQPECIREWLHRVPT